MLSDYLIVGGVAAVATWLLTFPARWLAERTGAIVMPDSERVHLRPTPTLGGAAMFVAFGIAMAIASLLGPFRNGAFSHSSEPLGVVVAAAVIFGVGLVDDLRELSAPAKVAGQVLAATALYYFGVTMYYFKIPFSQSVLVLSSSVTPLVTALWVVGIANAVNLIDGLDGLAAGVVGIAAAAFAVYGVRLEELGRLTSDSIGPLVAAIVAGVCLGFLPHNFHPAKIFMGDSGAMLLGLLMAAATAVVGGRTADDVSGHTYFFFAPVVIPLVVLGVPILDTAFAIVRRTARRTGVTTRDLAHLHNRLMQMGHGQRRAVLILWTWTALLSGFVLFPLYENRVNAYIPFGVAGLGVLLYSLFHPGVRHRATKVAREPDQRDSEPMASPAPGEPGKVGLESPAGVGGAPGSAGHRILIAHAVVAQSERPLNGETEGDPGADGGSSGAWVSRTQAIAASPERPSS